MVADRALVVRSLCLLPSAFCLLPSAFCLLLLLIASCGRSCAVRFWSVVERTCLDDKFLIVILTVPVNINLDHDFVSLSVRFARVESQTILAPQHPVD